jgi:glycosyltransferase involved in cell wall biosynthesis
MNNTASGQSTMCPTDLSVSVVIPTFNRAHCLPAAINSVLAQTRAAQEVWVVDDGSSDDSRRVVAAYGDRVRYLYQDNAGVSAARNAGVRASRSHWIAFLDSDDEWLPGKLLMQCQQLKRWPNAVAQMVDCEIFEGDKRAPSTVFQMRGLQRNFQEAPLRSRPLLDVLTSAFFPSAWLVSRHALLAAGGFDTSMRMCEDTDLLSRLALQGPFLVDHRVGTKLKRLPGGEGLSNLYTQSRLEYFENIAKTYHWLHNSPALSLGEASYVRYELSATHVEIALVQRMEGKFIEAQRSLMRSLFAKTAVLPLLKAAALMGFGARGYNALRGLKYASKSLPKRRSLAG